MLRHRLARPGTSYAFLEDEDIFAAIEYAAHQADHTVLQAS